MVNRLGYCNAVVEKKEIRPPQVARESFKRTRYEIVSNMTPILW